MGLSACMDYCISMGASIWARSEEGLYTRFIIKFEKSYETVRYNRQRSGEFHDVDAMFKIYEERMKMEKREEEESW